MTDLAMPPIVPPTEADRRVPPGPDPRVSDRSRPLPPPRPTTLVGTELLVAVGVFVAAVVGTWVRHGGASALVEGGAATWTSLAQLTGLLASSAGLAGLALVARPRSLERRYGLDRMFVWHKWLGASMAVLVVVHIATSLVAWAHTLGWWAAVGDLTGGQPYMAGATVGALLLAVVAATSARPVRRHLAYETWYLIHLTAYAALALSFAHQVVLGGDFATDAVARWTWIGIHVAVLVAVVVGRWGRLVASYLHPLRVAEVTPVAPGTVELRLVGRRLRSLTGDAGQFAIVRPLVPRLWWQGHPYSLSAAPSTDGLVFTVKDRGDASGATCHLQVGTWVALEGPYGALTADALDPDRQLLLVVGGIGVAPARALLQRLPDGAVGHAPVLLYRARHAHDLVHLDELRDLVDRRGGRLLTLVGRRDRLAPEPTGAGWSGGEPFSADALRAAVPDLARRQAVLCGSEDLCAAARRGLLRAGVDRRHLHYDRCWW